MGLYCRCPLSGYLDDIGNQGCPQTMGQIQKIAIQRVYSGVSRNGFGIGDITNRQKWTSKLTLKTSERIVISPWLSGVTCSPGEAITFGSGNEVVGGIPIVVGVGNTGVTGNIYHCEQSIIRSLKSYACDTLGVYLFDEDWKIGCLSNAGGNFLFPIPIREFFVGDKTLGGFDQPDSNAISWAFMPGWSDNFISIELDEWNPTMDLVNAPAANSEDDMVSSSRRVAPKQQ